MCEAADEGSMEEINLAIGRKEGIDVQDPINGDSALYLFLTLLYFKL
jgi:hypothetical protein